MIDQFVLSFTPSKLMKDWLLRAETDIGVPAKWYFAPRVRSYCLKHSTHNALHCSGTADAALRNVGREPYYNFVSKHLYKREPRIYVAYTSGLKEWGTWETVDDLRKSSLYLGDNVRFA